MTYWPLFTSLVERQESDRQPPITLAKASASAVVLRSSASTAAAPSPAAESFSASTPSPHSMLESVFTPFSSTDRPPEKIWYASYVWPADVLLMETEYVCACVCVASAGTAKAKANAAASSVTAAFFKPLIISPFGLPSASPSSLQPIQTISVIYFYL